MGLTPSSLENYRIYLQIQYTVYKIYDIRDGIPERRNKTLYVYVKIYLWIKYISNLVVWIVWYVYLELSINPFFRFLPAQPKMSESHNISRYIKRFV